MEEVHVALQQRFRYKSHGREIVTQQRYKTTDDLKQPVRLPFHRITPQMVQKMSPRTSGTKMIHCKDNDGAQTDHLDT